MGIYSLGRASPKALDLSGAVKITGFILLVSKVLNMYSRRNGSANGFLTRCSPRG